MAALYSCQEIRAERLNTPKKWNEILTRYNPDLVLYYLALQLDIPFSAFLASPRTEQMPRLRRYKQKLFRDVTVFVKYDQAPPPGAASRPLIAPKGMFRFNPSNSDWWDTLNSAVSRHVNLTGNKVGLIIDGERLQNDRASLGKLYNAGRDYRLVARVSPTERADNYTYQPAGTSAQETGAVASSVGAPTAAAAAVMIVQRTTTTVTTTTEEDRMVDEAFITGDSNAAEEKKQRAQMRNKLREERQRLTTPLAPPIRSELSSKKSAAAPASAAAASAPSTGKQMVERIASYMSQRTALKAGKSKSRKLLKNRRQLHTAIGSAINDQALYGAQTPNEYWKTRGQNSATLTTHLTQAIGDSLDASPRRRHSFLPRGVSPQDSHAVQRHAKEAYRQTLIQSGIFERLDNWLSQFDDDRRDPGGNDLGRTRAPGLWPGCQTVAHTVAGAPAPWDGYRFGGWRPARLEHVDCLPEAHAYASYPAPLPLAVRPELLPYRGPLTPQQQQQQQQQTVVIQKQDDCCDDCGWAKNRCCCHQCCNSDSSDDESVNPYHCDASSSDEDEDCCGDVDYTPVVTVTTTAEAASGGAIVLAFAQCSNFLSLFKVLHTHLKKTKRPSGKTPWMVLALPSNQVFTDRDLRAFIDKNLASRQTDEDRLSVIERFIQCYDCTASYLRSGGDAYSYVSKKKRVYKWAQCQESVEYPGVLFIPVNVLHVDAPMVTD